MDRQAIEQMHSRGREYVASLRGADDLFFWAFLSDLQEVIRRALFRRVLRGELTEDLADLWTFTHLFCSGFSIEEIAEVDPDSVEAWRRERDQEVN